MTGTVLKKNKSIAVVIVALLLSAMCFYYYQDIKVFFPSYTHAWAQGDRYALALQFIENNFNFFLPATYDLDPQFPAEHPLQQREGITRVDFPIHEYIIGIFMWLSGSDSPLIFRLYLLLYSLAGMIFLFLIARDITGSLLKSGLAVIFAFTSPLLVYYQFNFLPGVPSLANAIIGFYFYIRYRKKGSSNSLYLSVLFFTLSALSRTPFVIVLASVFIQHIFNIIKKKRLNKSEVLPFVISFIFIAAYYLYNQYLGKKYGSMFLNHLMPVHNLHELKQVIKVVITDWRKIYFTYYHYAALAFFSSIVIIYFTWFLRLKRGYVYLYQQLALIFAGYAIFALLMANQFPAHDYYFLDTFYLPVVLLFVISLRYVPLHFLPARVAFIIFSISFLVMAGKQAKFTFDARITSHSWDNAEQLRIAFTDADVFLDSLQVPWDARILVPEAYSNNIPLILSGRKGYTLLSSKEEVMERSLKYDFDYVIVTEKSLLLDVIRDFPGIRNHLRRKAGNGKIAVYEKRKDSSLQPWMEFVDIRPAAIVFESPVLEFGGQESLKYWLKDNATSTRKFISPPAAGTMESLEFSATFEVRANEVGNLGKEALNLLVSGYYFPEDEPDEMQMAFTLYRGDEMILWSSSRLQNQVRNSGYWQEIIINFEIPDDVQPDDIIKIFIYNPLQKKLLYDDMQVIIYKRK